MIGKLTQRPLHQVEPDYKGIQKALYDQELVVNETCLCRVGEKVLGFAVITSFVWTEPFSETEKKNELPVIEWRSLPSLQK